MEPVNEYYMYEVKRFRILGRSTEIIRTMNIKDNTSVGNSTDVPG